MKMRALSLFCIVIMLSALVLPAAAAVDVVDLDKKGSLSVTMTYKGKAVGGGELTIYRVAEVRIEDGNHSFRYLPAFEDCKVSLDRLNSSTLANSLLEIVQKDKIKGTAKTIDSKGKVTFTDMEVGLYLIVQTKAASGYDTVEPFVVSLPGLSNGKYVYDVDASPKMGAEPQPTTKPTGKLPQTGQINWPVPVMLTSGLLCILGGFCLRFSGKKKDYES